MTTFISSKVYERYFNVNKYFFHNKIGGKNKMCKEPPYLFLSQPNSDVFFRLASEFSWLSI